MVMKKAGICLPQKCLLISDTDSLSKDSKIPFVFCGINWDASVYGFPCSNPLLIGFLKVPEEQGIRAANTALN